MEKSWVNFVKCLLDRLYKLCLTYLYFSGIYFNVELFFFRILGGRTSLISSNQNLFLSNEIFLLLTCFTQTIFTKKYLFFQNNNLSFVATIISIIKSIIFIWKWIRFQIFYQTMLMGSNNLRNVLKCLNTLGRKFQITE